MILNKQVVNSKVFENKQANLSLSDNLMLECLTWITRIATGSGGVDYFTLGGQ